jgi:plastocyanin
MKSKAHIVLMVLVLLAACSPKVGPTPAGTLPPISTAAPTDVSAQVPGPTSTPEATLISTPESTQATTLESTPAGQIFSGEAEVEIEDSSFNPGTITIAVGTTVKWGSKDDSQHTVTSDDGSWGSATLNKGDKFSFTFSQAGTFTYHCSFHSSMRGTVVVVSP